jgi:hypothetical protein
VKVADILNYIDNGHMALPGFKRGCLPSPEAFRHDVLHQIQTGAAA